MKWGNPTPVLGDNRWLRVFALVPTKMTDGTWVWLEDYTLKETFGYAVNGLAWLPLFKGALK